MTLGAAEGLLDARRRLSGRRGRFLRASSLALGHPLDARLGGCGRLLDLNRLLAHERRDPLRSLDLRPDSGGRFVRVVGP